MLAMGLPDDRKVKWLLKSDYSNSIFSSLLVKWGAVFVNRMENNNLVQDLSNAFEENKKSALVISPEGSREKRKSWKSGFYYIAKQARVPIVLGYLDYSKKKAGFKDVLDSSSELVSIQNNLINFYSKIGAKNKNLVSDICFK